MSESHYSAAEERLNVITHGFGIVGSMVGLIALVFKANTSTELISSWIFGLSLTILYTASTTYHASKEKRLRARLRIMDHTAIYILIAGTYTPVCMITLADSIGGLLLYTIWSMAICGTTLKLFFTGKYDRLSTIMYIGMGWVAIFAINPLLDSMSSSGLLWLLAGGVFYTTGAILYSIRAIPMNHAIFHLFVLLGSGCHFIMTYSFIL